jgi:hypothetical protein
MSTPLIASRSAQFGPEQLPGESSHRRQNNFTSFKSTSQSPFKSPLGQGWASAGLGKDPINANKSNAMLKALAVFDLLVGADYPSDRRSMCQESRSPDSNSRHFVYFNIFAGDEPATLQVNGPGCYEDTN